MHLCSKLCGPFAAAVRLSAAADMNLCMQTQCKHSHSHTHTGFVGELDKKPTRKCVLDALEM